MADSLQSKPLRFGTSEDPVDNDGSTFPYVDYCHDCHDSRLSMLTFDCVNMVKEANFSFGHRVRLQVQIGNIIELHNTDSIVNYVYTEDIYGPHGIIEAAGDPVKKELKRHYDVHQHAPVTITASGHLPYKAIFHVLVSQELPTFSHNIHKALKLADRHGMRSIAFPAMECSSSGNKQYIDRYLQVFYEFEEQTRPACLHMIDIISSSKEDQDYHEAQMTKMGENLK